MKHSTGNPTKYEQERIDAMMRMGCVACAVLGFPNINELQCHHILSGGNRMGHWFTLPLCIQHHKGENWHNLAHVIGLKHRAAVHTGRKPFNRIYGTERELWERIQKKLKLPTVWPTSKVLARREYVASNQSVVELLAGTRASEPVLPAGSADSGRAGGKAQ